MIATTFTTHFVAIYAVHTLVHLHHLGGISSTHSTCGYTERKDRVASGIEGKKERDHLTRLETAPPYQSYITIGATFSLFLAVHNLKTH